MRRRYDLQTHGEDLWLLVAKSLLKLMVHKVALPMIDHSAIFENLPENVAQKNDLFFAPPPPPFLRNVFIKLIYVSI